MARLDLKAWGETHKITLSIESYRENGNLAIQMWCWDEEFGYAEPWSVLTVNLSTECAPNCAFIDTNNNGGDSIIFWLTENNLGKLTGRIGYSGFCVYPEFEFDMDELNKYVESV